MEVQFQEKYQTLSEMKAGDVACSKDRTQFFVCGHHFNSETGKNELSILDLNNLRYQYGDKRDLMTPIKMLKTGDLFNCTKR